MQQLECNETDLGLCLLKTRAAFILWVTTCTACTTPPSLPLRMRDMFVHDFFKTLCSCIEHFLTELQCNKATEYTWGKISLILITTISSCHQSHHVTLVIQALEGKDGCIFR